MRKLLVSAAILALPNTASALTRAEVAEHWAPVIYQEVHDATDPTDFLTAYDFDHDWNGDNNGENVRCWSDPSACTEDNAAGACAGQKCPLIATVYFTVIETSTHWFVQYMPYHPLDTKVTNGHEHDTESIFVVVAKSGASTAFGKLQFMETQFHGKYYQYGGDIAVNDGADNIDGPVKYDTTSGRPAVYSQMVGHGLCGGFSPPNYAFPDLQLTCQHDQDPHIDKTGVVYRPGNPTGTPVAIANQAVNGEYALVELRTSVWPHITEVGAGKAFKSAVDYKGERCGDAGATWTCPKGYGGPWEGNEGESPSEPWNQAGGNGVAADGDQFFDPAFTASKRVTFPQPYSLDYCFNPYLGITTPGTGCLPEAAPTPDAGTADATAIGDDAGRAGGDDAGSAVAATPTEESSGCGCHTTTGAGSGGSIFALLLLLLRRRRLVNSPHP